MSAPWLDDGLLVPGRHQKSIAPLRNGENHNGRICKPFRI